MSLLIGGSLRESPAGELRSFRIITGMGFDPESYVRLVILEVAADVGCFYVHAPILTDKVLVGDLVGVVTVASVWSSLSPLNKM
jgi:hypothetical protein